MRLIDADALYDKAEERHKNAPTPFRLIYRGFVDDVADAPTVDPVKHGKWVKTDYKPMIFTKCSLCGHRVEIQNKSAFCPGCGARMTNGKA